MCLRIGYSTPIGGLVRMDFAAEAMNYVADMKNSGVNIAAVNASWGSSNSGGLNAAVDNLLAADVMLIHAAGNSNSSSADFLESKAGVMNVAATDQNGDRAGFSNYGSWVDVAAPGVEIISTYHNSSDPANDYVAVLGGTSMAAPHVAGVAALLESCDPSLSGPDKFVLIVSNTCTPGSADIGGLLNARLALDAACGGVCGDGVCDAGEDECLCAADCGEALASETVCTDGVDNDCDGSIDCDDLDCAGDLACFCNNDGVCEAGEDCLSCPGDCFSGSGVECGNGVCEAADGEDCLSCPADCNGKQNGRPSGRFCCGDGDGQNPLLCSNPICTESGWACIDVPATGACCGDGLCEGAEDSFNCEVDCPALICGDGTCDIGEDACNCDADCGLPASSENICSDGIDDDCDSFIDCDDVDCDGDPACVGGCLPPNDPCRSNAECCSGKCRTRGQKANTCS